MNELTVPTYGTSTCVNNCYERNRPYEKRNYDLVNSLNYLFCVIVKYVYIYIKSFCEEPNSGYRRACLLQDMSK